MPYVMIRFSADHVLLLRMQQTMQRESAHTAATVHRGQQVPPADKLPNRRKAPHGRAAEPLHGQPAGASADAMGSTGAREAPPAAVDWLVAEDRAARGFAAAATAGMAMVESPSRQGEELVPPEQPQSSNAPALVGASRWRTIPEVT